MKMLLCQEMGRVRTNPSFSLVLSPAYLDLLTKLAYKEYFVIEMF